MISHLLNREAYVFYPRVSEDAAGSHVRSDEATGRKLRVRVRTATGRDVDRVASRYELSHVIYADPGHGLEPGHVLEVEGLRYRIVGERPLSVPGHHAEVDALREEVPI